MEIKQSLVPQSKYSIKAPYEMSPIGICVHNTANDASAKSEISYMKSNNNKTSYHIAVDDIEAIQAIPFNRNAWHSGDGGGISTGNRKYIGIEICYSKSGGDRFVKAEQNAAKVIAKILKDYNWGIDKVKKHQDFSGKYCPHRTLDMGWNRFLKMIEVELNGSTQLSDRSEIVTATKPTAEIKESLIAKAKKYVGNRCKELQTKLNQLGYNCGNVDGDFGKNTHIALIKFQAENGLDADGYAGDKTFAKLDELIGNKVEIKVESKTVVSSNKKEIVKKLQSALNELGIKGADGKVLSVDGDLGINTKHALSKGILRKGSKNSLVRVLQELLVKLGYKIGIDGSFGNETQRAIIKFQKGMGLSQDGSVGSITWGNLLDRL